MDAEELAFADPEKIFLFQFQAHLFREAVELSAVIAFNEDDFVVLGQIGERRKDLPVGSVELFDAVGVEEVAVYDERLEFGILQKLDDLVGAADF